MKIKTLALAMSLASAAAFSQTAQPARPANNAASAVAMPSGKAANLASGDRKFVEDAAHGGHTEIEASKMALEKAKDPKIRTFAQQMIDDHTKAGNELSSLAAAKGAKVPAEPSVVQKGKLKLMGTGGDFDKRYSTMSLEAHRDTVKLFEKEASQGQDAELKAFAAKTLPTLRHHLEMAQGLPPNEGSKK